jgi:hypothetical protein
VSGEFTAEVHAVIKERSGGMCEVCDGARAWDAHHRHPRKSGGTKRDWIGYPSNGAAVCRDCHNLIESRRNLSMLLGWLVPEGSNPESERFLYRGEYCRLTADGSVVPAPETKEAS